MQSQRQCRGMPDSLRFVKELSAGGWYEEVGSCRQPRVGTGIHQCASTLWVGYVCMIVQILITTETLTDSTQ